MLDSGAITYFSTKFIVGLLIFIRVSAMMFMAPVLSHSSVQPHLKIGLSAVVAMMLTAAFADKQPAIDIHAWSLSLFVVKEFLMGAAIGFASSMILYAVEFAGGLLDFDIGFQTSLLFDANTDVPTLIGQLKKMALLMVFLGMNGHHFLIEAISASFVAVPLDGFGITSSAVDTLVRLATNVTIIAVKIASPILLSLLLVNISLALLSRVAPQLNIFILSFQFKIGIGLLMLFITIPLFIMVAKTAMTFFQNETYTVIMALNPKR